MGIMDIYGAGVFKICLKTTISDLEKKLASALKKCMLFKEALAEVTASHWNSNIELLRCWNNY